MSHRVVLAPHSRQRLLWSVFNFSHSGGCVIISRCGFNVHSPVDYDVEHLSVCLLALCVLFLWMSIRTLQFYWPVVLQSCQSSFCFLDACSFSDTCLGDVFSQYSRFWWSPVYPFCFYSSCFLYFVEKTFLSLLNHLCHVCLSIPLICVYVLRNVALSWTLITSLTSVRPPWSAWLSLPTPQAGNYLRQSWGHCPVCYLLSSVCFSYFAQFSCCLWQEVN